MKKLTWWAKRSFTRTPRRKSPDLSSQKLIPISSRWLDWTGSLNRGKGAITWIQNIRHVDCCTWLLFAWCSFIWSESKQKFMVVYRLAEKYKDSQATKEKIQKSIEVKKEHLRSLQPGLNAIMQVKAQFFNIFFFTLSLMIWFVSHK